VRGRGDAVQVELRDLLDVVEHRRQLPRHAVYLVIGEAEASEAGDVEDLIAVDHAAKFRSCLQKARAPHGEGP
jgi:hypothetical protein